MTQSRIQIPRQPEKLIQLAQAIYAKHTELGTASPLNALDWEEKVTVLNEALAAHKQAEEYKRQMEKAYQQRDNLVDDITEWVRQSRDVLKGIHRQEMKKLGDFGFEVDDSPRSPSKNPPQL